MKTEKSKCQKNTKETDYRIYELSKKEKTRCAVCIAAISIIISFLFYKSMLPAALCVAVMPWVFKKYSEILKERRKDALRDQFILGMNAYASALRSGYSAENAIREAREEISRATGEGGLLVREFKLIERKLSYRESIESALLDLGDRTGIEEIENMSRIFSIAKRCGGSTSEIVTGAVGMLKEEKRVRSEITTLMTAKKLEYRIMCLMPAGILLYVNLTSPEFIEMLYEGLLGRTAMTIVLIVYGAAIYMGEKIMRTYM